MPQCDTIHFQEKPSSLTIDGILKCDNTKNQEEYQEVQELDSNSGRIYHPPSVVNGYRFEIQIIKSYADYITLLYKVIVICKL